MQRHFDRDIQELTEMLLRLGAMVEDAIADSIRALLERDSDLAQKVIERDDDIDQMELAIDEATLALIAKMQPTAVDLRFVATLMRITTDLERMGDLAQDVCERALELNREPALKPLGDMTRLARTSQEMVHQALDAFVRREAQLAREVIERDDEVDAMMEQSFRELLTYMMENPANIGRAIRLTFVGKYFERIADGATNICEMVVYLVEGKVIKHASISGDDVGK
ncbi:MAG TPA: phosphate signaling complex protein PhoU [Thermoanaerobaculia bacterium]|nr:phosphate signaling complex protein PhoU [Thermoanaerobaculia bacterium]